MVRALVDRICLGSYFGITRILKAAPAVTEIVERENNVNPIIHNFARRFNINNRIHQEHRHSATLPLGTFHPPYPQESKHINSDSYVVIEPSGAMTRSVPAPPSALSEFE